MVDPASRVDVEQFIEEGCVRIDDAFPRSLADQCRSLLWTATGCSPDDPTTWTRPVVRLGNLADAPFREAANTTTLRAAFDALVGADQWAPPGSLGTFAIRFPSSTDPGDCGWHVDPGFGWENEPDFLAWRTNVRSRGRALLMLFLFSDVSDADAPTRIRLGSHLDIARRLAPHGELGLTLRQLAASGFSESDQRPERLATGASGTVYLCHPFLVHSAQPHHGTAPRFLAQPPLLWREPRRPVHDEAVASPIEEAIRRALA
jgi:hypothetical protein